MLSSFNNHSKYHKKSSNGYASIPPGAATQQQQDDDDDNNNNNDGDDDNDKPLPRQGRRRVMILSTVMVTVGVLLGMGMAHVMFPTTTTTTTRSDTTTTRKKKSTTPTTTNTIIPMDKNVPWGVNLASWLSLEDYFFVGNSGAVQVATDWGHTAATCFPPLYTKHVVAWQSETDLFTQQLLFMMGHNNNKNNNKNQTRTATSVKKAILAFAAYRTHFIDWHSDLPRIAAAGFRAVRVPLSWCWTDHDPTQDPLLEEDDDKESSSSSSSSSNDDDTERILLQRYACVDPFLARQGETVYWPAVPKPFLVQFLKACHAYGLKAVLDIHTYAGGTSIGTFSGIWPKWSIFWQYDNPEHPRDDFGRTMWRNALSWMESLAKNEPDAFAGLAGITPMNEPGHLSGMFGPGSVNPDKPTFVPELPMPLRNQYLHDVLKDSIPNGPHLRILKWQSDAVQAFRETSLPEHLDLIVNVHESILTKALTGNDDSDPGGRHPAATQLIAKWWKQVTTAQERSQWAVLDMHHYHAWEPQCQGTVTGHDGSYTCGNLSAAQTVLHTCSSWAQVFRNAMEEPTARLSSGEFSAATHHSVLESCLDSTTLALSYTEQLQAAKAADVDLYFWTWKMPYGGAFRPAWSWQQLMHQLHPHGEFPKDESVIPCGV